MPIRRRSLGCGLALLTLSLAPLGASAGEGAYIGLGVGASFPEDQTFKASKDFGTVLFPISKGTVLTEQELGTGILGGLTTGYKFASGLRPELELNYTESKFGTAEYLNTTGKFESGGKEKTAGAFANLWFDLLKGSRFHPYIGAGVGALYVDVRKPDFIGTQLDSDDDIVFAYQGGAGAIFELTKQLDLAVDYRYVSSNKGNYDIDDNGETKVDMRYERQSVMASLRFYFGAPTPPPAPAPEPEPVVVAPPAPPPPPPCESDPTRSINLAGCKVGDTVVLRGVNFEFDQSMLTLNAKSILDQVADALTARPDIKVQVAGHTDSRGSDEYNQKLSESRAASVIEYLSGRGIDGARMTSIGYGETRPVADNDTDEGREQNRRVELNVTEVGGAPVEAGSIAPAADGSTVVPPAEAVAPTEAAPSADAPAAAPATDVVPAAEATGPIDGPAPEAVPVP